MIKQTFSITERNKIWLDAQVETGLYGSASEVVRDMIRERELREQETREEIEWLRAKLTRSLQSGISEETRESRLARYQAKLKSGQNVQTDI